MLGLRHGSRLCVLCGLGVTAVISLMLAMSAAAQTTLQVAVVWGEDTQEWQGFLAAGAEFEKRHPGVTVEFLPVTGWLGANTPQTARLLTLVAGGVSPDVTLVDGMMVPQYAHAGLLLPLDKYIEASGISFLRRGARLSGLVSSMR